MKVIYCNLIGIPTDVPYIRCDNNNVYDGVVSSTRVAFSLLDTDTGGAHLNWDNQEWGFAIPLNPGFYEGGGLGLPDLVYASMSRIRIQDGRFHDDRGEWVWRGATDFLLYKKYLEGQDITSLLVERSSAGANLVRVLGMCHNITRFYPQDYATYYTELPAFATLLARYGLYVEFVVFADQQYVKVAEQAHFHDTTAQLRVTSYTFESLGNELAKNSVDAQHFTKPSGIIFSFGSGLSDTMPPRPAESDYLEWHGRREWPKVLVSSADPAFCLARGIDASGKRLFDPKPFVHDESIGFAEVAIPGKRSTDPELALILAVDAALHGSGATFHSSSGVISEHWGPTEAYCADVFYRGLGAM